MQWTLRQSPRRANSHDEERAEAPLNATSVSRTELVRNVAMLAVACLCAWAGIATAQRLDENPEPSQPVAVTYGTPISFGRIPVHDPLWALDAPSELARGDAEGIVIGEGVAFFGNQYSPEVPLAAVDERTGKPHWTSTIDATPFAYANGLVFAATAGRQFEASRIVALDAQTGKTRWTALGGWITLERQLAIIAAGSRLQARDADTGRLRWSTIWSRSSPHGATLIGTTLLLHTIESGATLTDFFYAYDIRDGRALWTMRANAILGVLPHDELVLDTTWEPGAYGGYAPLTATVVALESGAERSSHDYAPDRKRWTGQSDLDAHFARDAAVDGDALVFRLGAGTVYRYPLAADPVTAPGTRFELGSLLLVGPRNWLVRRGDGTAALALLGPANATLRSLNDLDGVTFTLADHGLAFVAAHDRAVVFDPQDPGSATITRFPCTAVSSAVVTGGTLVAVCSAPAAKLVALALPNGHVPVARATPIPVRTLVHAPLTAAMHAYAVPTRFMMLGGTAFARDGTLWFYEHPFFAPRPNVSPDKDRIGHLKADGTFEEFSIPTPQRDPGSITRGPDGAMWFTETSAVKLGRIGPDGAIVEYALPPELDRVPLFASRTPPPLADPTKVVNPLARRHYPKLGGLVAGSDGALWVTAPYANAIVRVTTSGTARVFALPDGLSLPGSIARGPDGALWFTASGAIGRLTTAGAATRFPVDTKLPLTSIVWGPEGNLWYSFFDGRIGRITPAGTIKIFAAPVVAAPSGPLIGGCDDALYVADRFRPALWRVTTSGSFEQRDVDYAIAHLARATDCTLGFSEAQAPATSHVGTISTRGQH